MRRLEARAAIQNNATPIMTWGDLTGKMKTSVREGEMIWSVMSTPRRRNRETFSQKMARCDRRRT